jgi:hypothetical protein
MPPPPTNTYDIIASSPISMRNGFVERTDRLLWFLVMREILDRAPWE